MYPVSEAFHQAVKENTRRYYWTGMITTKAGVEYFFANQDIVKGSGYITSQCCGSTEIELGTVYAAEMDYEKNLLISITYQDTGVRIRKVHLPVFTLGLNEKLDDTTYTVLEDKVIQTTTFRFLCSYTLYGEFLDGGDGYWYGFSNEGNTRGNDLSIQTQDYMPFQFTWIVIPIIVIVLSVIYVLSQRVFAGKIRKAIRIGDLLVE